MSGDHIWQHSCRPGINLRRPSVPTISADVLDSREGLNGEVTLVIIDAQPGCPASNDPAVLASIERQAKLAVARGWHVITLTMNMHRNGPTHEQITRHLQGYPRWIQWDKCFDSGARQVSMSCDSFGYPFQIFRIVGVNTDLCVQATVEAMLRIFPHALIRVIKEGCNTELDRARMWNKFPAAANLAISSESID